MNSVNELLDKIKETRSLASDNALAGFLHTSRGCVSNWRLGKNYPDAVACARISEATGVALAKVIGMVGEARAISREEKAVWHKLATAAALVLALALGSAPGQAQASSPLRHNAHSVYYVNSAVTRSLSSRRRSSR